MTLSGLKTEAHQIGLYLLLVTWLFLVWKDLLLVFMHFVLNTEMLAASFQEVDGIVPYSKQKQ